MGVFLNEKVTVDTFLDWAKTKLHGFSYNQVASLTHRVNNIKTLEDKHSVQEETQKALNVATKEKLNEKDVEKHKKISDVVEVLTKINKMAHEADVMKDPGEKKEDEKDEDGKKEKRKINLDE